MPTSILHENNTSSKSDSKLKICRSAVDDTVWRLITDDDKAVDEDLEEIYKINRNLGMELEAAINALVSDHVHLGFIVGWKFAANPGPYLFGEIAVTEVYCSTAENVVHDLVCVPCDWTEVHGLLAKLEKEAPGLRWNLELHTGGRVSDAAESAFRVGWDCFHDPAKLIFEAADQS